MESLTKKRKLLLIAMRITCLQLLISVVLSGLAVAREGLAQEALNQDVSVQIENKSLKVALGILEKSANVKFTYLPQLVSKNDKVTINYHFFADQSGMTGQTPVIDHTPYLPERFAR